MLVMDPPISEIVNLRRKWIPSEDEPSPLELPKPQVWFQTRLRSAPKELRDYR